MIKVLLIILALLLSGCDVVLIPKRPSHVYYTTQPAGYTKVTTIYDYCDGDTGKPYIHSPTECTEFYDYHSGYYEGTCCKWAAYDGYYEEWCNWIDNCVGWRYTGSVSY